MRNQLDKLGKIKQGLHATQALFIFVGWALTLAVLTKEGGIGGGTWFYFALCFITAPALVYQIMVPIFPRARRFANVYAYAAIDILFTILWFSAPIAVAVWNSAGIAQGKSDNQDSDGSCNYFGYGSATKCSVSKASVGFGILIFFLFAGTAAISVLSCWRYRQTGAMPGGNAANVPTDDSAKDVWSSNIEERDPGEEQDERRKYGQITDEDGQGLLHSTSSYSMRDAADPHPGAPLRYEPSSNSLHTAQQYDSYVPSALSPTSYDAEGHAASQQPALAQRVGEQSDRAQYPSARYDMI